ncbi:MAG TPA: sigma-54 dependent transcriptional regulator [Tahibacter sp.]|uniref:sigma-54 interaction domain-containing protein n=1 Tax=Tahibacter sp. TaxID=2056211 RepID=UPI002CB4746C|nr:sigma-54 dependent transcriptional regulator [Tahibacter sp.]HSX59293.1 sigma-54 dependent transcriptional regulator [Tahibacter sp.]
MLIGSSPCFRRCVGLLTRYAAFDAPVLIHGETGTGKELAARHVHYASARRDRAFVPVNCGAIPDTLVESELFGHSRGAFTDAKTAQAGLIELAAGGTLFLDEVDSLSARAQVALLRFLQDFEYRPVGSCAARTANVRVLAATNAPLDALIERGAFRRDLLYRLNALEVWIPALRQRAEDVPLLATHFLERAGRLLRGGVRRFTDDALALLAAYPWPGNIRELENLALRAAALVDAEEIDVDGLVVAEPAFAAVRAGPRLLARVEVYSVAKGLAMHAFERGYLEDLMRRVDGNVSRAARLAGTERRQLGRLLKKHGLGRLPTLN